jgi:tetratricopeptide (TPR) repeat protein
MKLFIPMLLSFLMSSSVQALAILEAFDNLVYFNEPDPQIWHQTDFEVDSLYQSIWITLKREPILDAAGESIIPAMTIYYEQFDEDVDIMAQYVDKKMRMPAPMEYEKSWTYEDRKLKYKQAIAFAHSYDYNGFRLNNIWSFHALDKGVLWVSCDATISVYEQVESDFWDFLGSIYLRKNDGLSRLMQEASMLVDPQLRKEKYLQYLNAREDDSDAHLGLGLALEELDQNGEALNAYSRAIETDSTSLSAFTMRGSLLMRGGFYDLALKDYQHCLLLVPRHRGTLYNLACFYSLNGDAVQSLELLKQAVAHGYDDFDHIQEDGDLSFLRKAPEFGAWLDGQDQSK